MKTHEIIINLPWNPMKIPWNFIRSHEIPCMNAGYEIPRCGERRRRSPPWTWIPALRSSEIGGRDAPSSPRKISYKSSVLMGKLWENHGKTMTGWWFRTWSLFSIIYGIVFPIDEYVSEGWLNHQLDCVDQILFTHNSSWWNPDVSTTKIEKHLSGRNSLSEPGCGPLARLPQPLCVTGASRHGGGEHV